MGAALKLLGINVVGEARKEATAISLMRSMQPNVLLIDMHLSDEHSIAIATLIRKENPDIGIVMLVPCADLRLLGENNSLVPNGSKIVIKNSLNNVANLCEIISDSRVFDASTPATWVNGTVSLHEKALEGMMTQLTDTQIETLRLVADGLTNAEIGRMRFVSEKAVEQIVSRIAQVLNVQPDHGKNIRVQLVGEYLRWIGAPRH
jgi:DNA-binding NarL/FixJ family response regulator